LVLSQLSKSSATESCSTSLLQIENIDHPDEMYAFVIEALPALALSSASKSLEVEFSIVSKHIVLTGHKIDLPGSGAF
jgi:hypothetical protein